MQEIGSDGEDEDLRNAIAASLAEARPPADDVAAQDQQPKVGQEQAAELTKQPELEHEQPNASSNGCNGAVTEGPCAVGCAD